MNDIYPLLVISYRKEKEIRCTRSCNCYHGSIEGYSCIRTLSSEEELVQYLAGCCWSENILKSEQTGHYIISLSNCKKLDIDLQIEDLGKSIQYDNSCCDEEGFCFLDTRNIDEKVTQAVLKREEKEKAEAEKVKLENLRIDKERKEQESQRAKIAQEERERKEYQRLRTKFEGETK